MQSFQLNLLPPTTRLHRCYCSTCISCKQHTKHVLSNHRTLQTLRITPEPRLRHRHSTPTVAPVRPPANLPGHPPNWQAARDDSIVQLPSTLPSFLSNLQTSTPARIAAASSPVSDHTPAESHSVREHALRTRWKQNRPAQACLAVSLKHLRRATRAAVMGSMADGVVIQSGATVPVARLLC